MHFPGIFVASMNSLRLHLTLDVTGSYILDIQFWLTHEGASADQETSETKILLINSSES